jgi:hypothetical protein
MLALLIMVLMCVIFFLGYLGGKLDSRRELKALLWFWYREFDPEFVKAAILKKLEEL